MKSAKLLFIQKEIIPIGVEYISSILKSRGYSVRTVFYEDPYSNNSFSLFVSKNLLERFKKFLLKTIREERPDIIGFSTFTMNYLWSLNMADFIKKHFKNIPIIFGGYHATMVPEYVIKEPSIDIVCIGEGEIAVVELMESIKNKINKTDIKNLWFKNNGEIIKNSLNPLIQDLDKLEFPDKFISKISGNSYSIIGSRGCPYRCSYCANNVYASIYPQWSKVRFRSIENILSEIGEYLKANNKIKRLEIMDDVIALNNDRLSKLCYGIKEKFNIPYSCFLHPSLVNEESIRILKETDCYWLKVGVQSTSEKNRKQFLLRPETNEQIRNVAKWCHKYKLYFSFDHIYSLPCDSKNDLIESVKFYNETRPNIINFIGLVYLPKTKIIDDAIKKGVLNEADVEKINRGEDITSTSSNVDRIYGSNEKDREFKVLISRISYIFSLISFRSQKYINKKIEEGFLEKNTFIPLYKVLIAKFMAKLAAKQFFIYWYVIKHLITAPFRKSFFIN